MLLILSVISSLILKADLFFSLPSFYFLSLLFPLPFVCPPVPCYPVAPYVYLSCVISLRLWTEVADHNITDFLRSTSLHGYKQQAKGENV